ncbi:MAG: metalloregulator ArsR/SmtB family transcription factor [Gaiellaceae bacterium]
MSTNGLLLDALGDWTRRQIFEALRRGPRSVGDLAGDLPVSRPAVSQHLRVLKDAGLVVDRKDGARRIYSVAPEGLAGIRAYFDSFWDEAPDRFAAEAGKERA